MGLKIDIGCGNKKKEGCLGVDYVQAPAVDYVLDVNQERLPFDDESVEYVYSSHVLEHLESPNHLFQEIGRVCCDGAKIEIWTPYGFSNQAFLYGHKTFLTEEVWLNFCYTYRDLHQDILKGRWLLKQINYVVLRDVELELRRQGVSLEFALKYFKSVVFEFGVELEYRKALETAPTLPVQTYSHTRDGERFPLKPMDIHVHDPSHPQTFRHAAKKLLSRLADKL